MRRMLCLCLIILLLCGCGQTAAAEEPAPEPYLIRTTIEVASGKQPYVATTEYRYDEQGFLTETVTFLNGEESGRSTIECDEKGNSVKKTQVSGKEVTIIESSLSYDKAENLTTKIDTVTKADAVHEVLEYHFVPGTDKPSKTLRYKGTESEPYIAITYEYNGLGQEVLQTSVTSGGTARRETEYDEEGRLLKTTQFDVNGNILSIRDYTYEGEDTVCVLTDGKNNVQSITTFKEYEEGNTKLQEVYVDDRLMTRTSKTYSPTLP